ncbi:SF1B family DNA helicase RecD2 [Desulfonatronovibrio magnus]|uniref:SF1B family DNA helicase RecD2 n=1 Tax=Desulfonatronovibrio magnus TaxID=698827 RepID=UPI0005EB8CC2|nr:ATP-dependent RecD-like DNA helicase [Desulfonatronovibrio magnus]
MNLLKAEVNNLVYHNEDNGYVVARVTSPEEPGVITVCGIMGRLVPGEMLSLKGSWKDHPKYGRQFIVSEFEQIFPATVNGIKRYLSSGMIKGVGPIMADKMVEKFGKEVLDILEEDPDRLLEIDGLGPKKLKKIRESWESQREIRALMLFLQTHQIPTTYAGRIYKKYGGESISIITENPYNLVYDIRGVGFKTADKMALKLGTEPDSPQRLQAAIVYVLFQLSEKGHLFFPAHNLIEKVIEALGDMEEQSVEQALRNLEERKKIVIEDLPEQGIEQAVYLSLFYRVENEIARRLCGLTTHPAGLSEKKIRARIAALENSYGISLTVEQKQAVLDACINKAYVITGGPGTGKTTITRMIVRTLQDLGLKVKLAAPTGRAAKRLSQATGVEAATIHRLLKYNPAGGFDHNEENKLKADAAIVDEASMLDAQLMNHLLRALPVTCRLILVGDVNQLPAVGPGDVLNDILTSQALLSARLTSIFRQARESSIVVNAHRINTGNFPVSSPKDPPQADFFWVVQDEPQRIKELITYMVCERIPEVYGLNPLRDIQVLSPMHKGELGTQELNRVLQEKLNPGADVIVKGYRTFRVRDRVLQIRNNYEKEVFNGDLGWISGFDPEDSEVLVDFEGRQVKYDLDEVDELNLAYAVSVHKSQGSEYPAVVMPVVTQHFMLLQRNLIYTGLTRARKLAIIVGSKKAMGIGIKNLGSGRRFTHLRYRLQKAF